MPMPPPENLGKGKYMCMCGLDVYMYGVYARQYKSHLRSNKHKHNLERVETEKKLQDEVVNSERRIKWETLIEGSKDKETLLKLDNEHILRVLYNLKIKM